MTATTRLALVGDRSPSVRSHQRIPGLLDALGGLAAHWIPSEEAGAPGVLDGFDAVWALPGSPYRSEDGVIAAIRTAREQGIPFFGSCGGFQHALLEYARHVCGFAAARHAENDPAAASSDDLLIVQLSCSLAGLEGSLRVEPGSRAERLLGARESVERYQCGYGPSPAHLGLLTAHGLRFTGHDPDGEPRVLELPPERHPFFMATLFQPELAGDGTVPHPFVRGLAAAAAEHAAARTAARTLGKATAG